MTSDGNCLNFDLTALYFRVLEEEEGREEEGERGGGRGGGRKGEGRVGMEEGRRAEKGRRAEEGRRTGGGLGFDDLKKLTKIRGPRRNFYEILM